MAVFGYEGDGDLYCYGIRSNGGHTKSGITWHHVYNKNRSFDVDLTEKELKQLKEIYEKFIEENPTKVPPEDLKSLRQDKLNKINKL